MSQFILSPLAKGDLDEIWEYIAVDNLDAAERWLAEVDKAVHLLAERPNLGHTRKDLTDKKVLFWPVGRYLIIYRADRRPIEVVRIVSGYRDVPRLL
jgi:plasmid stabilization system protein ParE